MLQTLLLVALAVPPVTGQPMFAEDPCTRTGQRCQSARNGRSGSLAFFEFAPASGAGMGAACACTTPTGAKGETMTFTRTGDATCSKQGLATTGIANGDLVVCTANQPRVEASGGVLGLRVEGPRTNINVRSEEFNNAAYTPTGVGAAAPATPTANTATAPSNAVTADTLVLPATTAGQTSIIRGVIGGACAAAQCAYSVYVRGVSGGGTVDIGAWGSTVTSGACAFVDTSWTRCTVIATIAGTPGLYIGNDTANNGGTSRPAQSVYVWGGQQELGAYATSYIPTVAAAVTRNAESPFATMAAITSNTYSVAASFGTNYDVTGTSARGVTLWQSPGSAFSDDYFPTNFQAFLFDGTTSNTTSLIALTNSGRVGSFFTGSTLAPCVNGVCGVPVAAPRTINNITRVRFGVDGQTGAVGHINGIISRVCVDPDPTRCR